MFNNEKYSDATIRIHDATLHAHQLVISIQSKYLEKVIQERLVEGSSVILNFQEESGPAYWRVFEYLYTGDYLDHLSTSELEGRYATRNYPLCRLRIPR